MFLEPDSDDEYEYEGDNDDDKLIDRLRINVEFDSEEEWDYILELAGFQLK